MVRAPQYQCITRGCLVGILCCGRILTAHAVPTSVIWFSNGIARSSRRFNISLARTGRTPRGDALSSIVSRAVACFETGHLINAAPMSPGVLRRLCSGSLKYFYDHQCIDPDQHFLLQGYHGDFRPRRRRIFHPGRPRGRVMVCLLSHLLPAIPFGRRPKNLCRSNTAITKSSFRRPVMS